MSKLSNWEGGDTMNSREDKEGGEAEEYVSFLSAFAMEMADC